MSQLFNLIQFIHINWTCIQLTGKKEQKHVQLHQLVHYDLSSKLIYSVHSMSIISHMSLFTLFSVMEELSPAEINYLMEAAVCST